MILFKQIILHSKFFDCSENSKNTVVTSKEIQTALGVSDYKLQEIIVEVSRICWEKPELSFSYTNNDLSIQGLTSLTLKQIILKEARESLRFKIFLHIAVNPYRYSDEEFQKNKGVSRATYFRTKSALLRDLDLENKQLFNSSEAYRRYYIFNVLYYFSYFDFTDSTSAKKDIIKTINHLILQAKLSPTNSQRRQFLCFGAVNYWRSIMGYHLSAKDDPYIIKLKKDPNVTEFLEYLFKLWPMSSKEASLRSTEFFMTCLVNIECISVDFLSKIQNFEQVNDLTNKQLKVIQNYLGNSFSIKEHQPLVNNLLKINAKMLIPVFLNNSYLEQQNRDFYERSYIGITQLTTLLLNCRTNFNASRPLTSDKKLQLYYSYLFALLAEIDPSLFPDTVHIAVDFSQGIEYTNYIKKKFSELIFLNITLDKFQTPQTDIYVTNNFDPSFKNKQVIWDSPPLTDDWVKIHSLIVAIKNQKHNDSANQFNQKTYCGYVFFSLK